MRYTFDRLVESMNILLVLNDAPYQTERAYNALRLATSFAADPETTVRVFLIGDGAWCGVSAQTPPADCQYNVEWLMQRLLPGGREVLACRTCLDARGITDEQLIPGVRRGSLDDLNRWTRESESVLVF